MIPHNELIAILERVLKRSRKDEVRWNSMRYVAEPIYFVAFANSELRVSRSGGEDPLSIQISIVNANSEDVGQFQVDETDDHWPTALELYEEAVRCATGWDAVLRSIKKSLKAQGTIGEERRSFGNSTDDEIPF